MKIGKPAMSGTLESCDCQVMVEPLEEEASILTLKVW